MDKHERLRCGICGVVFTRSDSVASHKFSAHGQTTRHVCHMANCHRGGLGLTTHDLLVAHLRDSHQGATIADNEAALENKEVAPEAESSAVQNDDIVPDEEMEDLVHDNDGYPTKSAEEYETQIFNLQEKLEERHLEIARIHKTYKKQLEELLDKAAGKDKELEQCIKEAHDSIPS
ncbi:hypothetical protein PG997_015133 [Apiospora hydei]|uniref:C2H2-type domain-containing protein n=1 Tax=Apiospora hydei TaxID=1337664 RepID=A0ABR1UYB0_9PEZI